MKASHEIIAYFDGVIVLHRQYNSSSIPAHWHKELEIIYVSSGTALVQIAGEEFSAKEGDFLVCNRGDIHYCAHHSDNCILDVILFDPAVIWKDTQDIVLKNHFCPRKNVEINHLESCWKSLISDVDNGQFRFGEYYHQILAGELQSFIYRLILAFPAGNTQHDRRETFRIKEIQKVFDYVEQNYYKDLSLKGLAEYAGFSEAYLSKLFNQYAGVGFRKYLNIVRVYQAQMLLLQNNIKIIDAAMRCGFSNVRNFNRAFIQVVGCTPSEWMKKPDQFQKNVFYQSTLYLRIKNELESASENL